MASKTTNKQIQLKVLTPLRMVYEKTVDFVILRTIEGDMGVLYGHEPCSTLLDYGMLRIFMNHQEIDVLTVLGGIATVSENEVVVMSEMAERPDKLQEAINELTAQRDANKRAEQKADLDVHRAETALRKSLVHMDVSTYAIIKGHDEQSTP